jgi:thermitase
MKIIKLLFHLILLVAVVQVTGIIHPRPTSAATDAPHVEGELLVKFSGGSSSRFARLANTQIGASVVEEIPFIGWQHVRLPAGMSVSDAIVLYSKLPGVVSAQPNYIYHLNATPNDPSFTQAQMYGMFKIQAPAAWDRSTGSAQVVVAIIDTGIRYTHEDVAANMWHNPGEIQGNGIDDDANGYVDDYYGYNFANGNSNPIDDFNHGTHVAGTIGGVGNNGKGVVGVNWNVRLMAVKLHDAAGNATAANAALCFQYVTMMKNRGVNIRVTNNSWGGPPEAAAYDQVLKDAIDATGNAGILNVFAAGNDNRNIETTPSYPASYNSPSILAVASSTSTDARSSFSNFGAVSVDLAAPGSSILSSVNSGDSSYSNFSGTSMASPHAAGAAALLVSYRPNISVATLKATLMNTVDVLPQWQGLVISNGRLNVARAIRKLTTAYDFSGDGKTEVAIWNPSSGVWSIGNGADGVPNQQTSWGSSNLGDIAVPADYDGDGKTDIAVWRAGEGNWYIINSTNGAVNLKNWGGTGDQPVPADYDGDGLADVAVFRASEGNWYIRNSSTGTATVKGWGAPGDKLVPADYDGDGKTDIAVFRPSEGNWYVIRSLNNTVFTRSWGEGSDVPVPGDYDGDGKSDLAVFRPSTGNWHIIQSGTNSIRLQNWGDSTDKPVAADYDGDGTTDIAIWRAGEGNWYVIKSSTNTASIQNLGLSNEKPVPSLFVAP